MDDNTPIAELQTAYLYTCDNCGRDNFVRAIKAELDEEEQQEVRERMGEYGEGEFVMMPDRVTCPHCNTLYRTMDPRMGNEDVE